MNLESVLPLAFQEKLQKIDAIEAGRHTTFKITLKDGAELFAKLNVTQAEASISKALCSHPKLRLFTPEYFTFLPETGLLLTQFVNANSVTKTDVLTHKAECIDFFTHLHRAQLKTEWEWDIDNMLDKAMTIAAAEEKMRGLISDAVTTIKDNAQYATLVHGDLVAENILFGDSGFSFIDWEYAWHGDCRWDLVSLAFELGFSETEFKQWVTGYQMRNQIIDNNFLVVAKAWQLIYVVICRDWAVEHNQPSNKYENWLIALV